MGAPGLCAGDRRRALRKAEALPGGPHDLRLAVCARERVTDPTPGLLTVTAEDVFSPV